MLMPPVSRAEHVPRLAEAAADGGFEIAAPAVLADIKEVEVKSPCQSYLSTAVPVIMEVHAHVLVDQYSTGSITQTAARNSVRQPMCNTGPCLTETNRAPCSGQAWQMMS